MYDVMELIDSQLLLYLLKFFFFLEIISIQSTIARFIFLLIPLVSIIIPITIVVVIISIVSVILIIIIPRFVLPLTEFLIKLTHEFLHVYVLLFKYI